MRVNRAVKLVFDHIERTLGKPVNYKTLPAIRKELHKVEFRELIARKKLAGNTTKYILEILKGERLSNKSIKILKEILRNKKVGKDITIKASMIRCNGHWLRPMILTVILRELGVLDRASLDTARFSFRKHKDSDGAIQMLWGHILKETDEVSEYVDGRGKNRGLRIRQALKILGVNDPSELGSEHIPAIENLSKMDWELRGWSVPRGSIKGVKKRLKTLVEENMKMKEMRKSYECQ